MLKFCELKHQGGELSTEAMKSAAQSRDHTALILMSVDVDQLTERLWERVKLVCELFMFLEQLSVGSSLSFAERPLRDVYRSTRLGEEVLIVCVQAS